MKNEHLQERLDQLAVPPLDKAAREKARYRAAVAFANPPATFAPKPSPIPWRKYAATAMAVLSIALGLWVTLRPHSAPNHDAQLLAEMEKLFPGQLDGVICSNGNVDLDIAQGTSRPNSKQALALTLRRGNQIVRVLGFSGREVRVKLGGKVCALEPLVTGEGKIIVQGDNFVWTGSRPLNVAGYQLEARTLSL
jgi:hypothetical protein